MKTILDVCCGSKMFWFDKEYEDVLYADIRNETHVLCDGRVLNINPDIKIDFRNMPFKDKSFKLIVFDPPHLRNCGQSSWLAKKYGVLFPTWREDIKAGFDECMRCLDVYGTLIFKWNEVQIKVSEIINIVGKTPLFGHISGRQSKTIWMIYFKNASSHEK